MVMIETSPAARRQAEQAPEPDESAQPRRARRQALAATGDEPLVQVETRK
jgi:hypothetical protein